MVINHMALRAPAEERGALWSREGIGSDRIGSAPWTLVCLVNEKSQGASLSATRQATQ